CLSTPGEESETTKNNVSLLENQAMDFRFGLIMIAYNPKFEELKGPYLEKLPVALARFSNFLGDRSWFAGEKITYVDFVMYDVLDQHKMLEPSCLQTFQNLQDFLARFEALPPITAYIASPQFMKTPLNNRMAAWANHT
ncbi:glutathione S-transferase Mu 3-like, partial [Bombina bombina]|uniref:glutathione S-transferase Mu 3-like n=1 Tax=Bombina bombina TaxID=8345 RepID=UPI00235ABC3F